MGSTKAIKMLLIEKDMTARELAVKINMSQSTLSKKFKKDDFLESELKIIAAALNMEHVSYFKDKGNT